jgi:hypothetical protein
MYAPFLFPARATQKISIFEKNNFAKSILFWRVRMLLWCQSYCACTQTYRDLDSNASPSWQGRTPLKKKIQ